LPDSMPISADPLGELLQTLALQKVARTREDIFMGTSNFMYTGRVFGGQQLGQSLMAASATVEPDRFIHSMHGYFLRGGDMDLPITYTVDRIRDGKSFSTRRVQSYQNGEPLFSSIYSFQVAEDGLEHQDSLPDGIPEPESLPPLHELVKDMDDPSAHYWAKGRPFDMRHIEKSIYFYVEGEHVAHQALWFKTIGPLPDDQNLHNAALAYASDYSLLEPIYRRHGLVWSHPGLMAASLDHAMWFHRPTRVDEWLLYVQDSPNARGARGLSLGKIFNRKGELVATVAQEGLVRIPKEDLAKH
jgi:acyl-CoA thioesterase II